MNKKIEIQFAKKKWTNLGTKKVLSILLVMLFAPLGCETKKGEGENISCECIIQPASYGLSANCKVLSFLESASEYSKCNNYYIIKGVVLGSYEYGLNIELNEDLKGNFPKDVSTFIAWGAGSEGLCSERSDDLRMYEEKDILILHLTHADTYQFELPPEITWFEKPGDFTTITCNHSVLKLTDENVTGYISPNEKRNHWWDEMTQEELFAYQESLSLSELYFLFMDTMPVKEFQKKIKDIIK